MGCSYAYETWSELCQKANLDIGSTPGVSPVIRLIGSPTISVPTGNSKLKELGFTKLVKRDKGVYENVTASGGERRYMTADDPSSYPNLNKKIKD
jgi:hypothetical protein